MTSYNEESVSLALSPEEERELVSTMEVWEGRIPQDLSAEVLNRWWFAVQYRLSAAPDHKALLSFEKAMEAAYLDRGLSIPTRCRSTEELERQWAEDHSVPNSWSTEELERQWTGNQEELQKDPTDWDALAMEGIITRQYARRGMAPPKSS